jgi:hypothetical protein
MRDDPALPRSSQTFLDLLRDVDLVEDVIEAAIVGKSIEKRAKRLLGSHGGLRDLGDEGSLEPSPETCTA